MFCCDKYAGIHIPMFVYAVAIIIFAEHRKFYYLLVQLAKSPDHLILCFFFQFLIFSLMFLYDDYKKNV